LSYQISGFALRKQLDDAIYEVAPNGEIVWKWIAGDHLDELGFTPEALALVRQSNIPDYLHVNSMKPLGRNHWFRDGDARFDPDNIVISSREANLTIIIEKTTGHVVWRLGPTYPPTPKGPRRLPSIIDQVSGQHDPHLIPEGLAGAGNLLMFDNQGEAGFPSARLKVFPGSHALEIDPVKQQIVWEYTGSDSDAPEWTFYSSFISDARRLPNGNTFINEGMNGRFFQITPAGEIVWEYVSPYFGPQPLGPAGKKVQSNVVYRAQQSLMTGRLPAHPMASALSSHRTPQPSACLQNVERQASTPPARLGPVPPPLRFHSAMQDLIPRCETPQAFCGSRAFLPAAQSQFPAGVRRSRACDQTRLDRSRQSRTGRFGAVPGSHLGEPHRCDLLSGFGLDLMLAGFVPYDQPDLGRGGDTERHRRSAGRVFTADG